MGVLLEQTLILIFVVLLVRVMELKRWRSRRDRLNAW
jgi:hypothetical protein